MALIACYQVGYGMAAFGAGPLQSSGIDLSDLFAATAIVAAAMGLLAFLIARRRQEPRRSTRGPSSGRLRPDPRSRNARSTP